MLTILVGLACWHVSGSALAQPACNSNPAEAEKNQALEAMGAGVAFLNDPEGKHYDDAYPQFKRAYELSCSLNALRNLALCEMNLELDGDAIVHYEEVLAKKTDLAPEDRAQIQSDVARLKATVAWVTLSADRDGATVVDTRTPNRGGAIRNTYAVGTAPTKLGVHPGLHKFEATVDGLTVTWDIDISASSQQSYAFNFANAQAGLPQPPAPEPIGGDTSGGGFELPVYVWVVGGATVASAIVMGVMMGVSTAKKGTFEDELKGKAPISEQQAAVSDIQTFSLVADIFIGVTVVGAAATVVLALTAPSRTEEEANNKNGPQFGVDYTVLPLVSDHGGGAALSVQF
jgi:hypothetical protein